MLNARCPMPSDSKLMLYLAQVQKKGFLGKTGLQLLACQKSADTWTLVSEPELIVATEANALSDGLLVLVDMSQNGQVRYLKDAKDWVLDLVARHLIDGVTPDFLQQQLDEVENWRQSLTLQSQEISRRQIEIEARRDQIQELEEKLKQERKRLEKLASKLQEDSSNL